MTVGPIQAFVIGFPDNELFEGRIADELARLSDVGQIRIIDAVFVMRDGDDVSILSASYLDAAERSDLRAAVAALVGLGVAGDEGARLGAALGASIDAAAPTAAESVAKGLIADLPEGSSALVLAIEHLWAIPLRDAVRACRWRGDRAPRHHHRGPDPARDDSRRRGRARRATEIPSED